MLSSFFKYLDFYKWQGTFFDKFSMHGRNKAANSRFSWKKDQPTPGFHGKKGPSYIAMGSTNHVFLRGGTDLYPSAKAHIHV